ncbi:MAG: hypothetical protein EXS16_14480 [Gemmataceae bacterium]|nr:hypothetical protein [Gemmataceae bacterium]
MADQKNDTGHDFAPTRDHELQDAHYHDEDAEVVADYVGDGVKRTHASTPKPIRRLPPPKKWFVED